MLTNRQKISALIITKNEEYNIAKCISSVAFCDEIIVIDGGSRDRTVEIAEQGGCRVIVREDWIGFGEQKQRALQLATHEWVLSVDADEIVTTALASEIKSAVKNSKINGFYLNRKTNFLGHWMRYGGWYPDRVLRLARRKFCEFDLAIVHERLIVRGQTGQMISPLLHFSYRSVDDILEKQKMYALLGAEKLSAYPKHRPWFLLPYTRSIWTFFRLYFLQLGFLDGRFGLIAAIAKSQGVFWKYLSFCVDNLKVNVRD